MRFTALGDIGARTPDGASIEITGRSQRLVLGVLLAHAGRVVATDALVDALWADAPPPTAVRTLRSYISRLRGGIGDALTGRAGGYVLDVAPGDVDAGRFDELLERARTAAPADAAALLTEALGLWRGPAFAELADVEPIRNEARRLELRRVDAHEALVDALLRAGRPADAAAEAEALVARQPLREEAWALLVEARVASGAPGEALRAFQRAAAELADAGLEPSPRLRGAEARALTSVPEAADSAVARTGDPPPVADRSYRGPRTRTSFVGREADVAAVRDLLGRSRLVTLVGPGGVGKTRLATEVAQLVAEDRRLGARFVALADVAEAAAVGPAVADALDLVVGDGGLDEALTRAGELDLAVVLDNCEHVIEAAAAVVDLLLTGGDAVVVLATSRERLALPDEHLWPVAPLHTSGEDRAARRLFRDRAGASRPDLPTTPEADAAIDRIVRQVDGLPLAVEMAAALAGTTSLVELAESLAVDLDVLRAPTRGAPARHRTLRALLEWSDATLDDDHRRALADLSVFDGTFTAEDAVAALGPPTDSTALRLLAERSLVATDLSGDRTRYRLPVTVRRHASSRLAAEGRTDAVERRRAAHVLDAAREADDRLRSSDERLAHERFDELYAELRGTHLWARANAPETAAALSRHLHVWAASRQRTGPGLWTERLVRVTDGDLAGPAPALAVHAHQLVSSARMDDAVRVATAALASGSPYDALVALEALGDIALFTGRLDASLAHARDLTDRAAALGDRHYQVIGLCAVALTHAYGSGSGRSDSELDAGDAVAESPTDRGWLHYTRGEIVLDDDPAVAIGHLRRAAALADGVDNRFLGAVARVSLSSLQARVGEPADAAATFVEVVAHWRSHGAHTHLVTTLRNLVVLLQRLDEPVAAAELLGAVRADAGPATYGVEAERLDRSAARLREALGDHRYTEALRRGGSRTLDEAIDHAVDALGAETPAGTGAVEGRPDAPAGGDRA